MQNEHIIELTRQDLLDLVWSKPMRDAAPGLGVSDTGLRKICRRHCVPRPPPGYFLMKEERKPATPELPAIENTRMETIRFFVGRRLEDPSDTLPATHCFAMENWPIGETADPLSNWPLNVSAGTSSLTPKPNRISSVDPKTRRTNSSGRELWTGTVRLSYSESTAVQSRFTDWPPNVRTKSIGIAMYDVQEVRSPSRMGASSFLVISVTSISPARTLISTAI
jgi:hypothetical protein